MPYEMSDPERAAWRAAAIQKLATYGVTLAAEAPITEIARAICELTGQRVHRGASRYDLARGLVSGRYRPLSPPEPPRSSTPARLILETGRPLRWGLAMRLAAARARGTEPPIRSTAGHAHPMKSDREA